MSGDPRNVCQHREWTSRKIDTNEDGNAVRHDVEQFNEGELSMGDISEIVKRLDSIKNDTKTTADELFHFAEIKDPVPQTGQRKSQFWNLLTAGGKVPALEKRLAAIEETQAAILAAVSDKTV